MAKQIEGRVAVGIFGDRQTAERAAQRLRAAGFRDEEFGFLHHGESLSGATDPATVVPETKSGAAAGALAGGITGGVVGALLAGLIPGIGPVLAGGILAGAIGGATLGAAGGVVRTLLDLGVPEEDSRLYEQQFVAGRSILAVKANGRYDEAIHILRQAGASFVRLEDTPDAVDEFKPGNPAVVPESGAGVEERSNPTSSEDVAMDSYAASGEGSPRRAYGEGSSARSLGEDSTETSSDDAIAGTDSVRTGTGGSFGEATEGGGTERPGSLGGGETGMGSPGSTHDVGVRGQGTVGEARTRFERWQVPGTLFPGQPGELQDSAYAPADEEPALRFGQERATAPERQAAHWIDAEPTLRHDWESEHPETPWETVSDLVRQGWESASESTRRDVGLSDSSSGSPIDRDRAA